MTVYMKCGTDLIPKDSYVIQTYCPTRDYGSCCRDCQRIEVEKFCPLLETCRKLGLDCRNRDFFKCNFFQKLRGLEV